MDVDEYAELEGGTGWLAGLVEILEEEEEGGEAVVVIGCGASREGTLAT